MAQLVADCPRCRAQKITFDLLNDNFIGQEAGWRRFYETFCVCRHCAKATIFVLSMNRPEVRGVFQDGCMSLLGGAVNSYMNIEGHISIKDDASISPPEYVPLDIEAAFKEGATCLAVQCYNAAGTMFRLCVDLATKFKLPPKQSGGQPEPPGLNSDVRSKLAFRLKWLFDNRLLPDDLRELSLCIKDDGNDGAHEGTLDKHAANDLLDFTTALLERIYTQHKLVQLAQERRDARRGKTAATASSPQK